MKTRILSLAAVALLCSAFTSSAARTAKQDDTKEYLPEQGEFSVGVDLVPLIKTIGGAYNNTTSEVPVGGTPFMYEEMGIAPNISINGKYMFTDKWGIKVNLGVVLRDNHIRSYVRDDYKTYLDPNSNAQVIDDAHTTKSGGTLQVGAEYRVGSNRVQGVFGAGILAGFYTGKTSYTYGNAVTEFNRTPSNAFGYTVEAPFADYRITEAKHNGANGALGAYVSAGLEWFVAPKISLGAEVDLNFYATFAGKGFVKSEGYNTAYRTTETRTDLVTPGNYSFNFGTQNIGGALYMNFYFK